MGGKLFGPGLGRGMVVSAVAVAAALLLQGSANLNRPWCEESIGVGRRAQVWVLWLEELSV